MSDASHPKKFPYVDIYTVYLKCGNSKRLLNIFKQLIALIYHECSDVVYPIPDNSIMDRHFTYGVFVQNAKAFYNNQSRQEIYPWTVTPISVMVPYGNIDEWPIASDNWLVHVARTVRCIWHGARLIENDTPDMRKLVNLAIPWIPLDRLPDDCSDYELFDYAETILSAVSPLIWVGNKKFIIPHIHGHPQVRPQHPPIPDTDVPCIDPRHPPMKHDPDWRFHYHGGHDPRHPGDYRKEQHHHREPRKTTGE